MTTHSDNADVVILGSGAAGLTAALRAAVAGLRVVVLEKSDVIGGTSAMSGGGIWIPDNHLARAAGIDDCADDALAYLQTSLPSEWTTTDDALRRAFVRHAPAMLEFVEQHTPLQFALTDEPDPMAENPGGKLRGRMLSPRLLRRRLAGSFASRVRPSTYPHLFTYQELLAHDPYHHPLRSVLALSPKLLWRRAVGACGQGSALIVGLLSGCLDHGCRIEPGARAIGLDQSDDDRVTGVRYEQAGKEHRCHAQRGVVIATGGFEWDDTQLRRHFPGPIDRIASPRSNTGDGQRLAAAVGAHLDRLDQANVYPTLPTRYENTVHGLPVLFQIEPHAIVVNRNGERFASEYDYNFGEILDRRDPHTGESLHLPAWLIADGHVYRHNIALRWFAGYEPGLIRRADTLDALARLIGLPAQALESTVARFNRFCDAGRDQDFKRGENAWERYKAKGTRGPLGHINRPPYIALPINRSILGTKGGPRVNSHGQVLHEDGSVISGLYCAGNAMANPFGTRAVGAGTTLGPCMTWGYIGADGLVNRY